MCARARAFVYVVILIEHENPENNLIHPTWSQLNTSFSNRSLRPSLTLVKSRLLKKWLVFLNPFLCCSSSDHTCILLLLRQSLSFLALAAQEYVD